MGVADGRGLSLSSGIGPGPSFVTNGTQAVIGQTVRDDRIIRRSDVRILTRSSARPCVERRAGRLAPPTNDRVRNI